MINIFKIATLCLVQMISISSLGKYADTEILLIFRSDTNATSNNLLNYKNTKWGSSVDYVTNATFFSKESADELFQNLEDSFPMLQKVTITPLFRNE